MTDAGADVKFVATSRGRIAYRETGAPDRPAALFVHGIPTSSFLWRHVMRSLAGDFHCLAPDLMGLGRTEVDPARTDFSMPAQAESLVEFLDALGVPRAHVVAHDQGGAAGQILAARHSHKVDRLVLTDCVAYDNWPVPVIRRLMRLARVPGLTDIFGRTGLAEFLEARTPLSAFRRGFRDPARLAPSSVAEYLRPLRGAREERERFRGFLLAGHPRHTMAVAPALRDLACPTLVLWAADDAYLSPEWARRLWRDIRGAEIAILPGAGHFWPEEAPAPFAERIRDFLAAPLEPRDATAASPPQPTPSRGAPDSPVPTDRLTCAMAATRKKKPKEVRK